MSHIPVKGLATNRRPTLGPDQVGFRIFDTDLGITLWWNGTNWVDHTGEIAGQQTITLSPAERGGHVVNHAVASPVELPFLLVETNDEQPTVTAVTVTVEDLGTGTAEAPGQYATGPWEIEVPQGTPHGTVLPLSFAHVQSPDEDPEIPPMVTVVIALDSAVADDPELADVVVDDDDIVITLNRQVMQTASIAFITDPVARMITIPSPAALNLIEVTTDDEEETLEDIVVTIADTETGDAVSPGQYATGPWIVNIPAGTAHGSVFPISFAHVQSPGEVPAIPPPVTVVVELDSAESSNPDVMEVAELPAGTKTITLFAGGGEG